MDCSSVSLKKNFIPPSTFYINIEGTPIRLLDLTNLTQLAEMHISELPGLKIKDNFIPSTTQFIKA